MKKSNMGRPPIHQEKTEYFQIRVPVSLKKQFEKYCHDQGKNMSEIMLSIIRDYLQGNYTIPILEKDIEALIMAIHRTNIDYGKQINNGNLQVDIAEDYKKDMQSLTRILRSIRERYQSPI